jgi:hypothetical protein
MLGGFLHICTCTCTIYCGLWPPDNTSCIFLTWYQSLGSLFFWHAQLVPFSRPSISPRGVPPPQLVAGPVPLTVGFDRVCPDPIARVQDPRPPIHLGPLLAPSPSGAARPVCLAPTGCSPGLVRARPPVPGRCSA